MFHMPAPAHVAQHVQAVLYLRLDFTLANCQAGQFIRSLCKSTARRSAAWQNSKLRLRTSAETRLYE